jgi:hypothetical protein
MNQVHEIEYFVDGEPEHTSDRTLTAREILRRAGLDAETHYLMSVKPAVSYQGKPDEVVRIRKGQLFVSVALVPTPVA